MTGAKIVYRDLTSPLGPMIAGASDLGVCFLEWHDRGGVERIKERVVKRYKTSVEPGDNLFLDRLGEELGGYFEGTLRKFQTPIDVAGTTFEKEVWRALLDIGYGWTRSYGEIARILNRPGASRAVGRANGANYLAILIPCHRVIDCNGGLHGYGGGLHRKRYLLDLEARVDRGETDLHQALETSF